MLSTILCLVFEATKPKRSNAKCLARSISFSLKGASKGYLNPLDNPVLAALSLEVSVTLARKQSLGYYQLDQDAIEGAIEASWDAIIQNTNLEF